MSLYIGTACIGGNTLNTKILVSMNAHLVYSYKFIMLS